ncbi:Uncharacterised protein [Streptococcus acidominimus]|uniref:Uncharacterized protein n=1 Tax=Streptococcus acidominimus TaxID=1326 RepID=A0A239X086_STRAI|nr:hypothetical protein [Streptococcus acidominimus]SNV39810.1 Uncharacterised protein [Streptococcus acidominimus]
MYKLYFILNGKRKKQGEFSTLEEAEKHMMMLIDNKSRIKSWYIVKRQKDNHIFYDYGAHNAEYIVEVD